MAIINKAEIRDPHSHIAVNLQRQWVVVVTWSEPESGACVMGPYATHTEARTACTVNEGWLEQFAVEVEPGDHPDVNDLEDWYMVTDDVTFTIALCGEPYLI